MLCKHRGSSHRQRRRPPEPDLELKPPPPRSPFLDFGSLDSCFLLQDVMKPVDDVRVLLVQPSRPQEGDSTSLPRRARTA